MLRDGENPASLTQETYSLPPPQRCARWVSFQSQSSLDKGKPTVLAPYYCYNKPLHTYWLKTTQILSCSSRGWKSGWHLSGLPWSVGRAGFLWKLQGKTHLLTFLASRGCLLSLVCGPFLHFQSYILRPGPQQLAHQCSLPCFPF